MAGKNCQSCKHNHMHTHIHTPCRDAHPDTLSQLLTPRARPAQVDILHKWKIYTQFARTGAATDLCVCVRSLSALLFFYSQTGICSSFHYSNTLFCVFSLPLILFRRGAGITHLLVTRRQMEKDYSASSIFIQRPRPFSAGKLSPLLEMQHKGSKNSSSGQTAQPKQTHTVWLCSNYSIHQERVFNMWTKGEYMRVQISTEQCIISASRYTHSKGCNVICQTGPIMLLCVKYFTAWCKKRIVCLSHG